MDLKERFLAISGKNASKQNYFEGKTVFGFDTFYLFDQKICFHEIKTFTQDFPHFKLVEKKITFWVILSFILRKILVSPERKVFVNFWQKCFKILEKLCLAVWG